MSAGLAESAQPTPRTDAARERLLAVKGEPLLFLEWHRVMFFHYKLDPTVLQGQLPAPFELETHAGKAIVSLVALTKRRFRANHFAPLWAKLIPLIREQRLFNVRTYVSHHDESGAFFFWSWLSRPWGLPCPARPLGLTCAFADSRYCHTPERGELRGCVTERAKRARFIYSARLPRNADIGPCKSGSLAEFALERYTGYFWHRAQGRIFRAWHPPWLYAPVQVRVEEANLVLRAFPWMQHARFVEAHYAPGFGNVWIGQPHALHAPPTESWEKRSEVERCGAKP
jgi:hypothetical protein